ncbi:MAG: MarR family transcriptional regulator [Treponemataceae bacterium]|nr:MarR family transcriptional regulator [Treponemataceae bacterium]
MDEKTLRLAQDVISLFVEFKKFFRECMTTGEELLSPERFQCLLYLSRLDEAGLTALSELLHVSSSALCTMLGGLEKEGLVVRERSHDDRREVRYRITSRGKTMVETEKERRSLLLAQYLLSFSEEEQERLKKLVEEFSLFLKKMGCNKKG